MKEQLISFETAKLAKEKGFNIPCESCWLLSKDSFWNKRHMLVDKVPYNVEGCDFIMESSQSQLQKWIREEHNIEFVIKPFHDSSIHKTTYVADPIHIPTGRTSRIARQDSYEEALEKGLQEALNLI